MRDRFFFFLASKMQFGPNSRRWFVSGATSSNNSFRCGMRPHVRRWIPWRIWDVFFFFSQPFDLIASSHSWPASLSQRSPNFCARDCIINRSLRATLSAALTLMAFLKFTKCYLVWPHRVLSSSSSHHCVSPFRYSRFSHVFIENFHHGDKIC